MRKSFFKQRNNISDNECCSTADDRMPRKINIRPIKNCNHCQQSCHKSEECIAYCVVCLNSKPRKNVPSNPPYVTEAILSPSSTTAVFVSVKSIAPAMRKIPHSRVKKRDHHNSFFSIRAFPREIILKRSRYVAEASELMEEDKLPIAEASTPAIRIPASPVGRF